MLFVALSGKAVEESYSSLKIIQPLDKSRYIGENATFVIEADFNLVDTIVISEETYKITKLKVTADRKTYCETLKLHTARNIVNVSYFKDDKLVKSVDRDLYFLSELFEGVDEDEAEDYKIRYLHNDKKEEKCKSCHNMKSNIPTNGEAFEDVSKTTCYECHKGMINTANTHAPVTNWLCLDCHNGKFAEYNMDQEGKSKYLAPDPISKTCTSCHETVEEWTKSKYTHGPVNDGRCERCHNPHGSNNEFFLRKPIWEICVTCHAEKANGKHVVSAIGFGRPTASGGHPTKDRKDPARLGRDLSCTSCHNPHGSNGVFLLRMNGTMPFGICNRCHKK